MRGILRTGIVKNGRVLRVHNRTKRYRGYKVEYALFKEVSFNPRKEITRSFVLSPFERDSKRFCARSIRFECLNREFKFKKKELDQALGLGIISKISYDSELGLHENKFESIQKEYLDYVEALPGDILIRASENNSVDNLD